MSNPETSRPLKITFGVVLAICLLGLAMAGLIWKLELNLTDRGQYNIFYYLFSYYEPANLAVLLLVAALLYYSIIHKSQTLPRLSAYTEWTTRLRPLRVLLVMAGLVGLLCWVGTHLVHHNHAFAMDEFSVNFQAKILAQGQWSATLPPQWRPLGTALAPVFVVYDHTTSSWHSAYLPGYALLKAPFYLLGLPSALNPLLAAISILAIAGVARRVWPAVRHSGLLAALLLASSPQFLLMSMSGFSMSAHLCLNLVWLYLYTGRRRACHALAPWVGFMAMGLHAPVPHLVFVFPFLLRLVLQRRWQASCYYAAVYLGSILFWLSWVRTINPDMDNSMAARFSFPGAEQWLFQGANLALIFSWQSLAISTLAILGLTRLRQAPPIVRDLAISCATTFAFYLSFNYNQGHGWGYRYFFGALGCLVLLAIPGWQYLRETLGNLRATSLVAVCMITVIAFQLPIRFIEAENVVRPFAHATALLKSRPEQALLLHPMAVWYGQDLVRNEPFMTNRSKILFLNRLNPHHVRYLQTKFDKVSIVPTKKLIDLGMYPTKIVGIKRVHRRPFH